MTDSAVTIQLIISLTSLAGTTVVAAFGYLGMKASREARDVSHENKATLIEVKKDVDGHLSDVSTIAAKMTAEVTRLQEPGTTTPTGAPTAANPVTMTSMGVPMTDPNEKRASMPPAATAPTGDKEP